MNNLPDRPDVSVHVGVNVDVLRVQYAEYIDRVILDDEGKAWSMHLTTAAAFDLVADLLTALVDADALDVDQLARIAQLVRDRAEQLHADQLAHPGVEVVDSGEDVLGLLDADTDGGEAGDDQ